jgi:hypothetical protein
MRARRKTFDACRGFSISFNDYFHSVEEDTYAHKIGVGISGYARAEDGSSAHLCENFNIQHIMPA